MAGRIPLRLIEVGVPFAYFKMETKTILDFLVYYLICFTCYEVIRSFIKLRKVLKEGKLRNPVMFFINLFVAFAIPIIPIFLYFYLNISTVLSFIVLFGSAFLLDLGIFIINKKGKNRRVSDMQNPDNNSGDSGMSN